MIRDKFKNWMNIKFFLKTQSIMLFMIMKRIYMAVGLSKYVGFGFKVSFKLKIIGKETSALQYEFVLYCEQRTPGYRPILCKKGLAKACRI